MLLWLQDKVRSETVTLITKQVLHTRKLKINHYTPTPAKRLQLHQSKHTQTIH